MLNLLIISNNFKAESIRKRLQPMLKARIDIFGDFDLGMKEVFEKRPSTVIIQDQISGVSAENVARHIQMLLGKGGPAFILMHDGNPSVKKVKGVFEHVVDVSMPAKPFFDDLLAKLILIYGDQWQSIFVPSEHPGVEKISSEETICAQSDTANKLVDELLFDLQSESTAGDGNSEDASQSKISQVNIVDGKSEHQAIKTEEIAALLVEAASESRLLQLAEDAYTAAKQKEVVNTDTKDLPLKSAPLGPPRIPATDIDEIARSESSNSRRQVNWPLHQSEKVVDESHEPDLSKISDDILLSFEKNYRAESTHWKSIAIITSIVVCILAGGWFLYNYGSKLMASFQKKQTPPASSVPLPVSSIVAGGVYSSNLQKRQSSAVKPIDKEKTILPSFVSDAGRDRSYIGNRPGWERYLDNLYDVRLYRPDGRIKAIQVLAVKGKTISDTFIKNVLKEIVGNDRFKLLSVSQKNGLIQQRYSLFPKGEMLIYRSKASKSINAFVVSID